MTGSDPLEALMGGASNSRSSSQSAKKNDGAPRVEAPKLGQTSRELNPYFKDGGKVTFFLSHMLGYELNTREYLIYL